MLIDLNAPNGSIITIEAKLIVAFRSTYGDNEPANMTSLAYSNKNLFCTDNSAAIVQKAANSIKPVQLTLPAKIPVTIDAAKVAEIQSTAGRHHPDAKTLLIVGGRALQVREDPDAVRQLIRGMHIMDSEIMYMSAITEVPVFG